MNYGQTGSTLSGKSVTGTGMLIFTAAATVSGAYTFSVLTELSNSIVHRRRELQELNSIGISLDQR